MYYHIYKLIYRYEIFFATNILRSCVLIVPAYPDLS